MIEGKISKLDLSSRTAVLEDASGKEITLKFPERMNVEIVEPETMGTMGGDLEDLEPGYMVQVDISTTEDDGICVCDSLVSLS